MISKHLTTRVSVILGGAIFSGESDVATTTTIDRTSFLSNTSFENGGAMELVESPEATVTVTVTNTAFDGNSAVSSGGALSNSNAHLRVENSSFTGNSAGVKGGGLFNRGNSVDSRVRLQSVTVFGNSAPSGGGGGIANEGGMALYSTTIVGNSGGGILTTGQGSSRFRSTVLQNGGSANCTFLEAATRVDEGGNLSTGSGVGPGQTCHFTGSSRESTSLNPGFGLLTKDPNGLTSFLKAGAGSPLIDRGVSCPTLDQIGGARFALCDIGAIEFGQTATGLGSGLGAGGGVITSP